MTALAVALGALVYVGGPLKDCPANLPPVNAPQWAATIFRLPHHACIAREPTGAYIANVYGLQRADQQ